MLYTAVYFAVGQSGLPINRSCPGLSVTPASSAYAPSSLCLSVLFLLLYDRSLSGQKGTFYSMLRTRGILIVDDFSIKHPAFDDSDSEDDTRMSKA